MWKSLVWSALIWFGFAKEEVEKLAGGAGSHFHGLEFRDFPGGPMVKTALPMQGPRVQSLVRELRSHMPHGQRKKNMI